MIIALRIEDADWRLNIKFLIDDLVEGEVIESVYIVDSARLAVQAYRE